MIDIDIWAMTDRADLDIAEDQRRLAEHEIEIDRLLDEREKKGNEQ